MAKKRRKLKKGPFLILLLAVVLGCGIAGAAYLLPGEVRLAEPVEVTIDDGMGTGAVARRLAAAGVVKNSTSFVLYVRGQAADKDLRPGTYVFAGEVGYDDILGQLRQGRGNQNTLNVTVPEGKTVPQIADIWEAAGVCTAEDFLQYCANLEIPYDYIPAGEDYNQLEGFLFPETYNVLETWGAREVVDMMLGQFDRVWTEERQKLAKERGLTAKELVTVASLIEREAKVAEERPLIASVIYNRLAIGQKLQIDATIQYIIGEQVDRVLYSDLERESPYNTYLHEGLPPGPICSPGASCIDAALSPAETDYYYYRTKSDGSGEHWFAETYAEHQANGAK